MKKNGKPHNSELVCAKCDRPVRAKGLCASHYNLQWYYKNRKSHKPAGPRPAELSICEYPRCGTGTSHRSGLCTLHLNRMRKFGITKERLIELGSGICEACGAVAGKRNHAIDHDHAHCATGCAECIRGVLCFGCNAALGFLGDSVERLEMLKRYLEK